MCTRPYTTHIARQTHASIPKYTNRSVDVQRVPSIRRVDAFTSFWRTHNLIKCCSCMMNFSCFHGSGHLFINLLSSLAANWIWHFVRWSLSRCLTSINNSLAATDWLHSDSSGCHGKQSKEHFTYLTVFLSLFFVGRRFRPSNGCNGTISDESSSFI